MKNKNTLFELTDLNVPENFDNGSGTLIERIVFNNRGVLVALFAIITLILGWQALQLQVSASYEKTIPANHPYIQAYKKHEPQLYGLGNAIRIVVSNPTGSIYDAKYMETLRQLNDEVFLLPGVSRQQMRSLWTSAVRWTAVTEEGLEGGPLIPDGYDGSAQSLQSLGENIARSGEIGQLVARDGRSSAIFVPLMSKDSDGRALNYKEFAQHLESLRVEYQTKGVNVHITGYAKLVGDLIDGVQSMLLFFAAAVLFSGAMVYAFSRCLRSATLIVTASLVAVIWQLGLFPALGIALDPYSILVPFLVFAIGMSHGTQKLNGIAQDIGRGFSKYVAARLTFRRLFTTGMAALVTDAFGFAVLLVIDIGSIRDLAISACLGVGILILTNLILLPVLLSYTGVSKRSASLARKEIEAEQSGQVNHPLLRFIVKFTQRRWAAVALVVGLMFGVGGYWMGQNLSIGDLDPGAPELRSDSRYNKDVAFVNEAYGASSDVLAVMVSTPEGYCTALDTVQKIDHLEWQLRQIEGVEATNTVALMNRRMLTGLNEGSLKWYEMLPNQAMVNSITTSAPRGLYDDACSLLTLYVYLQDHKAATLERVVKHVETFAVANDTADVKFKLAAGSAGIEAATNMVVKDAWGKMLLMVYAAVIVLAYIAFRSWRAVAVAILPLVVTSFMAEGVMVALGMGVKVATLPVIAVGVGIGVDYALYVLAVMLTWMRQGLSLSESYFRALVSTGKVVLLTGVTLAIGVITWVFSPIKFQADMGILLAFMFLWNMLGALIILPALAHFLLKPGFQKNDSPEDSLRPPLSAASMA
jgi:uncharacterized protein